MSWLEELDASLAVTTYQVGKLLLLGRNDRGQLATSERSFRRAMGVTTDGQTLWLATAFQVWRMEHQFDNHARDAGYDRLFVPRIAYTTGDLDLHDIAIDSLGQPLFVATLFNCLATVSTEQSFEQVWRPPFITTLTAEDRCHLNGLAMVDGQPRYVTLCHQSDVNRAWKKHRMLGGELWSTTDNEPIVTGLSMPHSPRWHDGRLWLLNSGTGYLGYVDLDRGEFEPVAFVPGYARGLAFVDHYAIVGLSRPREQNKFGGLALDDELAKRGMTSYAGLAIVDLETGQTVQTLEIEGRIAELYDVAVLAGIHRPAALGLSPNDLRYNVWADAEAGRRHWRRTPRK
ncbi:TIGR03032 family protein [Aeoliella sp. ICT_H6.2]|uniref:TIGR03032 family protein n=1 Tax=Aeoliella straminimaris TaxID=2954799 RepID=A0A9X2F6I4_9BACT|nr:TIGR03032 family protein [Aeoliella straminimaris]